MAKRKGPGRDATSAKAIATKERHARWLELRKAGKSYRAIAAEERVTPAAVHEVVSEDGAGCSVVFEDGECRTVESAAE